MDLDPPHTPARPTTPAQRGNRRLGTRARLAVLIGRAVAGASRLARLGEGSVIGGRAALAIDPHLLTELTGDRAVALVSATNGKTTTTRLLTAAVSVDRAVVANLLGANMAPGHVAALAADPAGTAVLEVDEGWLPRTLIETRPEVVVVMNLSRDQLDRSFEVRQMAQRWRDALCPDFPGTVVANADDPMVAFAATDASRVIWVGTGMSWRADARGCPACTGRLVWEGEGADWHCGSCELRRPDPESWLSDDGEVVFRDGRRVQLTLSLPGRANRMNATMALIAAVALGANADRAAAAMAAVTDVAGRYLTARVGESDVRLLLAKNPAGWQEALEMIDPAPQSVIVSINARVADGHDPSWLWDVPFEMLQGRRVVATGERRHDLAVRLRYAEVDLVVADDLPSAVAAAGGTRLDVVANYTAFQEYLDLVGR